MTAKVPRAGTATVLVASNRGPVSFATAADGSLVLRRGGGGLVSGLRPVARSGATVWVCAAMSDADRHAAAAAPDGHLHRAGHDTGGATVQMLTIEPATFHLAYNTIANSVLWFIHHHLFDTPNQPWFDRPFRREWQAYVTYNEVFANALAAAAAPRAAVVIQDYHLALVPGQLRQLRPDLRIGHFSHTPWAAPSYYRVLPDDVGRELLLGMLAADCVSFLSPRWADAFLLCCEALPRADGVRVDRATATVTAAGHRSRVSVHPLGIDGEALRARGHQADVEARLAGLRDLVGDRKLIVRVDRTELAKNIVRGLAAYRELLRIHPRWHGKVVHLAFAYPSRHDLPEYRDYMAAVRQLADEINEEFATSSWTPLILEVSDDYPRSLAAYRLADVLVVNPLRDGMNLVAKEVPVLSDRGCAIVLSRDAGAVDVLGADALVVNPYDVSATAAAMNAALAMDAGERLARTRRLAAAATAVPPQQWFADQIAELNSNAVDIGW
jgi:trehalose 6-phosphate synthase